MAENVQRYRELDWPEAISGIYSLGRSLVLHNFQPTKILGIGRGGSIPATILSHYLGVQEVEHLRISSYKDQMSEKITTHLAFRPRDLDRGLSHAMILGAIAQEFDDPSVLIVDDLWDTGNTMDMVGMMFPRATLATVFFKGARPPIGFPGLQLPKDRWVVFPWEAKHDRREGGHS